jgi:hypothetical protein
MDIGKFLRLQGAITSTIEGSKGMNSTQAGSAVEDAYYRLRQEAREAIPDGDREEFDRLFPDTVNPSQRAHMSTQPVSALERYGTAQSLLAGMSGWLDGYVREARLQVEAEAYAVERVKQERGTGFRPQS